MKLEQIIKKYGNDNEPVPVQGIKYLTFRCEIMNACFSRGCYYPEDDWSIFCYGNTLEKLKQDLLSLPNDQLLEIFPDGFSLMLVERYTIKNSDGSLHSYDVELEDVSKLDEKLSDKIIDEIYNTLIEYQDKHKKSWEK